MALFQPTNITPSTFSGGSAGTVDVNEDLTVSWQVNGSSPMVAYKISFYQNDTSSTAVYNTGKVTLVDPFYGVDYKGAVQFFSTTITSATMTGAGMTNGYANGYKMVIQQWWGATDDDSITQTSASYFITRATPTLTLGAIANPLTTRSNTFTATYLQTQGDAIEWARWEITLASDESVVLTDTGKIYGTSDLQTSYDGFITGNSYKVRCTVQTVNGVEVTTGWSTFAVSYASSFMDENVAVCALCTTDAVQIVFPENAYIAPTTINGTYSYVNDGFGNRLIQLPTGSDYITYDKSNGNSMSFAEPFTLVASGRFVTQGTYDFISLQLGNGGSLVVSQTTTGVKAVANGYRTLFNESITLYGGEYFKLIITNTGYTLQILTYSQLPLFPALTLYPGNSVYPSDGSFTTFFRSGTFTSWQIGPIESVTAHGAIELDYLWILVGTISSDMTSEILADNSYHPTYAPGTYFLANFDDKLAAGSLLTDDGDNVTGFSIYRQEGDDPVFYHLIDSLLSVPAIRDYGTVSQKTYQYFFYAMTSTKYTSASISSVSVTPLFWNYTLMCCSQDANGVYHVQSEYRFALDVRSGPVTNNNTPTLLTNFTRYPLIQPVNTNYRSGTLSAFIGKVKNDKYVDSVDLMEELYALSTNQQPKFLKNRKGELMRVEVSAPVTMQIGDSYAEQPVTISLPWAEVASSEDANIVVEQTDSFWNAV